MHGLKEFRLEKVKDLEVLPWCPQLSTLSLEKMNVSSLEILACCPSLKKIKVWNVSQLELIPQQIQSCRGLEEISLKFCSDLETVSD